MMIIRLNYDKIGLNVLGKFKSEFKRTTEGIDFFLRFFLSTKSNFMQKRIKFKSALHADSLKRF